MTRKLNQVVAAETEAKGTAAKRITGLLRLSEKREVYEGLSKIYSPIDEDGERLPPEERRVQARVPEQLQLAREAWSEIMDITFTKDAGNCDAVADIVIGDETILESVPVTYLLFLEKRAHDMITFVGKLPTLDEAHDWSPPDAGGLHRTEPVKTHRTKKIQKPIVLHPPTTEHPAQTQLIVEDQIVGHYDTVRISGAIPYPEKRAILRRCERLLRAIKEAREKANMTDAPERNAKSLLDYVFKSTETS